MIINPKLQKAFKEYNIDYDEGILYLLSVHFNLMLSEEKFEQTIKQVNFSKIIERDYSNKTIKWNIPLFYSSEERKDDLKDENWSWVIDEYRKIFTDIRPDAGGTKEACVLKMKKLFVDKPHIRKDDIIEATKMYVFGVKDPQFLQKADYFIEKGRGIDRTSRLEEFLEILVNREKQIVVDTTKQIR